MCACVLCACGCMYVVGVCIYLQTYKCTFISISVLPFSLTHSLSLSCPFYSGNRIVGWVKSNPKIDLRFEKLNEKKGRTFGIIHEKKNTCTPNYNEFVYIK